MIPIASTSTGLLSSSAPTLTFYWPGKDAKAVLLFIPGGPGQIGLKTDTTEPQGERPQMLKRLSDPEATSGRYDVVLIDSPYPLSPNSPYPSARGTTDHVKRIEATALYSCSSGFHMFHNAGPEVAKAIDDFLSKIYP